MSDLSPISTPYPVWFERSHWPGMDEVRRAGIEVLSPGTSQDPYHGVEQAVAIVAGVRRYDREVMDRAPKLAVIARSGIGYDSVDVAAATQRGIYVCNAPESPTVPTAEHAVALMMAVAKQLPTFQHHLRQGDFSIIESHTSTELDGKLLGLVGLGRIGRRVAAIAAAIGMRVAAFDPYLPDDQFLNATRADDLSDMLASADVVSLHIPLTAHSRGLISSEALGRMKRGVILINTARGGLVDTNALVEAVSSGRLGGVGMDVTDPEPLPVGHPLLGFDNVLITPHVASWTPEGKLRMLFTAKDEILAVLTGRMPKHLVNPEVLSRADRSLLE